MIHSVWSSDRHNDADLRTFRGFGLKVQQQLGIDTQPDAIKLSCFSKDMLVLDSLLNNYTCPIVFDFTSVSPCDEKVSLFKWLGLADILVLNTHEAEIILNHRISTHECMQEAANELLQLGSQSVFLLGAQAQESLWDHDYWTDGIASFWLTQARFSQVQYPERRTVLSAALTAALAHGYTLKDAIIVAKMYVHQAIRLAQTSLFYDAFPENEMDLPYLAPVPLHQTPKQFKPCSHLGLYPIVDRSDWVEMLLQLGVKTIQLRIKERTQTLEAEIRRSICLAQKHHATLFINDYWELALKCNAKAVHLGQSDLETADIDAIRNQGLLLGVSTHCYYEVARAHALCPSYIAIGPVYPTTSKEMPFTAQGIERLHRWQRTLSYPLVAIGGINYKRISEVLATGVKGVAVISAITEAVDARGATEQLLSLME